MWYGEKRSMRFVVFAVRQNANGDCAVLHIASNISDMKVLFHISITWRTYVGVNMTISSLSNRSFAFFSAQQHVCNEGFGSHVLEDPAGEAVLVNYIGRMIDGVPGNIKDGKLYRPPAHETYKLIGELGPVPGKLQRFKRATRHDLG